MALTATASAFALTPAVWAQGGDPGRAGRAALFPVHYGEPGGEPQVGAHMPDIASGLRRIWTGEVLSEQSLAEAMRLTWVPPGDPTTLSRLDADVNQAEERFMAGQTSEAIPLLEKLIRQAEALMPQISAEPRVAERLLRAHILLWWALSLEGESGRLPTLMQETVARFPAAVVDTLNVPPDVAQAFAVERRRQGAVSVTVELNASGESGCEILVGGFKIGDGPSAALGLPPGRPYTIAGRCQSATLVRRVQVEGPQIVSLDMTLAHSLLESSAGATLQLPEGPEEVARMVRVSTAAGRALGAEEVILAGIHDQGRSGRVLQLDRIVVGADKPLRQCSVRLGLKEGVDRTDIDQALRAVRKCKPFVEKMDLEVATSDNVYLNPEEFVESVGQEGSHPLTWSAAALSLAALSSAVLFEFVAAASQEDLDNCVASAACRGTARAEGLRNDLGDTIVTRDALYGVTAALTIGAVILYFVETPSAEDVLGQGSQAARSWTLSPWIGASGFGASAIIPLN